jgi:hypothetical protein
MSANRIFSLLWILAATMFVLFLLSFWRAVGVEGRVAELTGRSIQSSMDVAEIALEGGKLRRFEKEYLLHVDDAQRRAQYYADWKEAFEEARKQIAESSGRGEAVWTKDELVTLDEWGRALAEYGAGFGALAADVDRGVVRGSTAANQAIDVAKKRIAVLVDGSEKQGLDKYMQLTAQANGLASELRQLKWATAGFGVLSLTLMVLLMLARKRTRE